MNEEKQVKRKQSLEYEYFTRQLISKIIQTQFDSLVPPVVRHNAKLQGRSGCLHQIDVYWEIELGGVSICVAIECKSYRNDIEVGQVRDFYGVIVDTNVRGLMVTTKGFQKGARLFAEHYGINLMVAES